MFPSFNSNPSFGGAFSSAPATTNVFGQNQMTQPSTSTSLFGATTNTFGSQVKPAFTGFGAPNSTTSVFGQVRPTATPGIFGANTATVSPFSATGGNQVAGTCVTFQAVTGSDTMMRNGAAAPISTRHQCITCMKEYEGKSLEELRLEDYQLNRKGPQPNSSMFGNTPAPGTTNMFSSMGTTPAVNTFGQTTTAFGTAPAPTGLFGGLNQPKPATGFFSTPSTSTSAFGAANTFSFNPPTSQPANTMFGNTNPTSTASGLNTAFSFAAQPQQPNQGLGLFGSKPLTTTSLSNPPAFSSFGATSTNNTLVNKPLSLFGNNTTTNFNSGTSTFGQTGGGIFGPAAAPAQPPVANKTFSFGGFGSTPATSQSGFGTTTETPAFSFSTPAPAASGLTFPSSGLGTFGTTTSTAGFSGFGTTAPSFSLGGQTGQAPTFGQPTFSFGQPANPGFSFFSNPNPGMQMQQTGLAPPPTELAFATTPYKDSPLFYNLINNRNLSDLTKPTSPLAQKAVKEASRRRTSNSVVANPSTVAIKNLTFPVVKSPQYKKYSVFDGFEDDDLGTTVDILSPKSSVKKLDLSAIQPLEQRSRHVSFLEERKTLFNRNSFDMTMDESTDARRPLADYTMNVDKSMRDVGHSGQDDPAKFQRGGRIELNESPSTRRKCGLICTRPGYYIRPSLEELDLLTDEDGNCFVEDFVVGRYNFGELLFREKLNVAGLNLDELVLFRHKELHVYPDDIGKPEVGQGLNKAAQVTLTRVWPVHKVTNNPIKSPTILSSTKFEEKLKRSCKSTGSTFVSYDMDTGDWVFTVPHFSTNPNTSS